MDLQLRDKVALITGAGSGIGAAIARTLAAEGAVVYAGDLDVAAASRQVQALSREGLRAFEIALDVGDQAAIEAAVRQIEERQGRIDILVNSAGIVRTGLLDTMQTSDWRALSTVNVEGIFTCSRAVLGGMVARRYGKILNLASISAFKGGGLFGNTLYGTSKAAVIALTLGFAREYGPHGVNVNAMAPGLTQTAMTASMSDADRENLKTRIPVRRVAEPQDIANVAAFLVSDRASYVNGATLVVDGGVLTL
ncbi:MAG: SDR family NAD(P)-dependent oxidoreductase [Vulcanimicrobiaceae bacterium]